MEQINRQVFIAGPYYSAEDRYQTDAIDELLRGNNYSTFVPGRDGIDRLYSDKAIDDDAQAFRLARAVFALNVYVLAEKCDALVFTMNGRVPDEGGIILSALAFMLGVPVLLFKNDARSKLHGHDNSMISGLGCRFRTFSDIEQLPVLLGRLRKAGAGTPAPGELSRPLRAAIDAGRLLWQAIDKRARGGSGSARDRAGEVMAICNKAGFGRPDAGMYDHARGDRKTVYCSGPLFCPGEIVVMDRIASVLESAGFSAFLPHRDGLEAFVLNQVDSPFANTWLAAPMNRLMHRGGFAIDVYAIVSASDFFVVNASGRVPDDGAMAEIGLAFAAGKPIVIYKDDSRCAQRGRLDPMILGASCQPAVVSDMERLPQVLNKIAAHSRPGPEFSGRAYPASVTGVLRGGRRFLALVRKIGFLKPGRLFGVRVGR